MKCAARDSLKYRTQTLRKNRRLHTIAQLCLAISSQLRHISTIGKNVKWQCSSICPHNMLNFRLLTVEICWRVWGTPANFNRFRVLDSLLHRRRSTEVNKTLHDVWPSHALVYCWYTVIHKNGTNLVLSVTLSNINKF